MHPSTPVLHPPAPGEPCASCVERFHGRYCPACGERRLEAEDRSVRRFLGEAVSTLTDVDSTLLRTFGALVARPGRLTAEYLAGRRTRYLRPVQLFIFCNVLYFFLQPMAGFNPLTLRLDGHVRSLFYSDLARSMVEAEVAARRIPEQEYAILFDATITSQAKTLVFLFVPLVALVLHAMHFRARRWFADHLVFATHFVAVFLLMILALSAILHVMLGAGRRLGFPTGWLNLDEAAVALLLAMLVAYLYPALRQVYGGGRAAAALRAAALGFLLLYIVQFYRLILFFTTFHAV